MKCIVIFWNLNLLHTQFFRQLCNNCSCFRMEMVRLQCTVLETIQEVLIHHRAVPELSPPLEPVAASDNLTVFLALRLLLCVTVSKCAAVYYIVLQISFRGLGILSKLWKHGPLPESFYLISVEIHK